MDLLFLSDKPFEFFLFSFNKQRKTDMSKKAALVNIRMFPINNKFSICPIGDSHQVSTTPKPSIANEIAIIPSSLSKLYFSSFTSPSTSHLSVPHFPHNASQSPARI